MKNYNIHNSKTMAETLGARVHGVLAEAIKKRGSATLVVSGGSTPKPMFNYLSKQDLDWSKVTVTLADERCVAADDPRSNALMVKQELLKNKASDAQFINLLSGDGFVLEDQQLTHEKMQLLPRFDMVILGMGDDGHTASIFPMAENRDLALDITNRQLALVTDPKTVGPMRITQTARRLLDTDLLAIHFAGASKAALFQKILAAPDAATWPLSFFVTQKNTPVEVYQSDPAAEEITL